MFISVGQAISMIRSGDYVQTSGHNIGAKPDKTKYEIVTGNKRKVKGLISEKTFNKLNELGLLKGHRECKDEWYVWYELYWNQ